MNARAIHKPLIAAGVIMLLVAVLADPSVRGLLVSRDANAVGGYSASDLLGQLDGGGNPDYTTSATDNGDVGPNAQGFNFISTAGAVALDAVTHRLFVVDTNNQRILVFNLDTDNALIDRTADFVLGQAGFTTNAIATTQSGFQYPIDVAFDSAGQRLFVVDGDNRRVMVFDVTAITNGEDAVSVLGQTDFVTGTSGTTQGKFNNPTGVSYDSGSNRLYVGDQANNRVMVFDVTAITNGEDAVNVLGQTDFTTGTGDVTQGKLSGPHGLTHNAAGTLLYVTDQNNNRVMVFDVTAITNGEDAVNVLGQPDFVSSTGGTAQGSFTDPHKLAYDTSGQQLYVGDASNHRVMVFDVTAITNGEDAVDVYGQSDFTTGTGGTTQSSLRGPGGVTFDSGASRLYVVDLLNHRVMIFGAPAPTPTPTPAGGGGGSSPPAGIGFTPEKIVINSDEPSVDTRNVLVAIYARFSETFVGTVDVILSNDPTFPTYTSFRYNVNDAILDAATWPKTIGWDLCWGVPASQCIPGKHIVYARFYVNTPPPRPALTPAPLFP